MMRLNPVFHDRDAVFFDLDDTLKLSTPGNVEMLIALAREAGVAVGADNALEAHRFSYRYWSDREQVTRDLGALSLDDFWSAYIARQLVVMGADGSAGDLHTLAGAINRRFAAEYKPVAVLAPGADALLRQLSDAGLILGLVSNRERPLAATTHELGILHHFDFTLAAGEVGAWKPETAIFTRALDLAGVSDAARAVYVGDNYWTDVLGAQEAGLGAILVDRWGLFPEARARFPVVRSLEELLA